MPLRSQNISELRESTRQCQSQIASVTECLELAQVDSQRIDQKVFDLQENIFLSGVEWLEGCKASIARLQQPSEAQISAEAYQEHARGTEQALEQCRSQLATQEKKIQEGEGQMHLLQGEIAELTKVQNLRVKEEAPSSVSPEVTQRLMHELRNQQIANEPTPRGLWKMHELSRAILIKYTKW